MPQPDVDWHTLQYMQNKAGRLPVALNAMEALGSAGSSILSRMPRYLPAARHRLPSPTEGGFKNISKVEKLGALKSESVRFLLLCAE